jgi:hypothetical protein
MCRFPSLVRIRMVLMVTDMDSPFWKGDISDPLRSLTRHRSLTRFFVTAKSVIALNCMHQRIQSPGRIGTVESWLGFQLI